MQLTWKEKQTKLIWDFKHRYNIYNKLCRNKIIFILIFLLDIRPNSRNSSFFGQKRYDRRTYWESVSRFGAPDSNLFCEKDVCICPCEPRLMKMKHNLLQYNKKEQTVRMPYAFQRSTHDIRLEVSPDYLCTSWGLGRRIPKAS